MNFITDQSLDANQLLQGWTIERLSKDGERLVLECSKGSNAARLFIGWYNGDQLILGEPRAERLDSGVKILPMGKS